MWIWQKKVFVTGSENWTYKLRLIWNCLFLKDTPFRKCTVQSISCHEVIFHVSILLVPLEVKDTKVNEMKTVKSLEESFLLIKVVSETIENEANEPESRFLGMLLGTLRARLLGYLLAGKEVNAGDGVIRAGEGAIRRRATATR